MDISDLLKMDKQGVLPDRYRKVVDDYKEAVDIAAKKLSDSIDKEVFGNRHGVIHYS